MTKPRAEHQKKGEESRNFERSLSELERIVSEMEDGKLGLEDMIKHFEQGQALVKFCTQKLNEVEKKIEILVKKGDAVVAEPFEPEVAESEGEAEDGDEKAGGEKGDGDKTGAELF